MNTYEHVRLFEDAIRATTDHTDTLAYVFASLGQMADEAGAEFSVRRKYAGYNIAVWTGSRDVEAWGTTPLRALAILGLCVAQRVEQEALGENEGRNG